MRKIPILFLSATAAMAQAVISARAGTVHFTVGDVYVDEQPIHATTAAFLSLRDGQVLRTGRGRAELLLAPAVFLRLGPQGSVRMVNTRLEATRVEIQKGAVLIEIVEIAKGRRIEVGLGETRAELGRRGLYRFESDRGELRVLGGEAEVFAGESKAVVGRGRIVKLGSSLPISKFDTKTFDGLHQWAARRSFLLYVTNFLAGSSSQRRALRTDWEFNAIGWLWNPNFSLKFYSARAAAVYRAQLMIEEQQKRPFDQTKNLP